MRLLIVVGKVLLWMVGAYICFAVVPALVLWVFYNAWNSYYAWAEGIGPGNWIGIPVTVGLLVCIAVSIYEYRRG